MQRFVLPGWQDQITSIRWSSVAHVCLLYGIVWVLYQCCFLFYKWWRRERLVRNIPAGPSMIRALKGLASKQIHRAFLDWVHEYGEIYFFRLIHEHIVVLTDPTLTAEVLRNADADKNMQVYWPLSKPFSDKGKTNLLSHPTNEYWQLIRKGVMPSFSMGSLKQQFPGIQKVLARLEAMLKRQDGSQPLNITHYLSYESLDVLGAVGFDCDMGGMASLESGHTGVDRVELTDGVMSEAFKMMGERGIRYYRVWDPEVVKGKQKIVDYQAMIKDLLAELKARPSLNPDSIAGRPPSYHRPRHWEASGRRPAATRNSHILRCGHETTTNSMAWIIYNISQHPEVLEKVEAELAEAGLLACAGNPRPRPVEWDDLVKAALP
eukprot:jgi/Botrbrau1/4444/Bobra.0348s0032.1